MNSWETNFTDQITRTIPDGMRCFECPSIECDRDNPARHGHWPPTLPCTYKSTLLEFIMYINLGHCAKRKSKGVFQ